MYTHLQVDTVLEGCAFFLERSAYHVIQPTQLSAHLQATGMIQSHARAFSGVWEAEATGVRLPQLFCSAFGGARRDPLIHTPNAHPQCTPPIYTPLIHTPHNMLLHDIKILLHNILRNLYHIIT